MKQNDFYEVDGCTDFIPVKVIEVNEYRKRLKVEVAETGFKIPVPITYSFPKINEPQKVVVPKFVAEWIKKYKEKGYRLSHALEKVFDEVEMSLYIKQQVGDYTETIARAWLTYPNITVEQEKLYTVEIEGVSSSKLFKNTRTNEYLFSSGKEFERYKNEYLFHIGKELELWYTDKLTEQEIKKADERLWEFAKEVEE